MARNRSDASSRAGSQSNSGNSRQKHRPFPNGLPVACTQTWCKRRFASEKDMKYHKIDDPDHFYCKKCDVDCDSWEGLTAHKVEMMAPFIYGEDPDGKPVHITCEFCGEDFRSYGGRKRHRAMEHPAHQNIQCPTAPECSMVFANAADMIHHFEFDGCCSVSSRDFKNSILRKRFNKQLLPLGQPALEVSSTLPAPEADVVDDVQSALPLGTEPSVGQILTPCSSSNIHPTISLVRSELDTWPRLPGLPGPTLLEELATQHANEWKMLAEGQSMTKLTLSGELTSPVSPACDSAVNVPLHNTNEDIALLSPPPSPPTTNLLEVNFWDPESPDYNVKMFYHNDLDVYCCPFPHCQAKQLQFEAGYDVQIHLQEVHCRDNFSCKSCRREYKSATGLVAHTESTQRCLVKLRQEFHDFFDEMTGGFLEAHFVKEPKIARIDNTSTDLVPHRNVHGPGVAAVQYTSKLPKA